MTCDADGRLRDAGPADAAAIAALHTRSWRSAYRGSLTDAYLDGPIEAERLAFWRKHLSQVSPDLVTLLVDGEEGALRGFVCCHVDNDARWGSLINNLHVDPDLKGQGLGRVMMRALGRRLEEAGVRSPLYLYVLCNNAAASGFYARLGGEAVEQLVTSEPDGSDLPVTRVAWPSLSAFVDGVG